MKPLKIKITRSGYVVRKKELRTVEALEAELTRLDPGEAQVVPAKDVSYRKVAAALRALQKRGIFVGMIGNAEGHSQAAE